MMLLSINNLNISFSNGLQTTQAVRGLSLELEKGQTLGLVGESGSGKSVTALSILQLLPSNALVSGSIRYTPASSTSSLDVLTLRDAALRRIRGAEIAMIFQEPMSSLNPVFQCGVQVTEAIRLHQRVSAALARDQTLALFEKVKLPDPERIFRAYPHELSGGQKQRVMIAMALSCQPAILIADEPTTALDVTVQKTILELLRELQEQEGLSMLFISHDLGVISEIADRVAVMSQGEIVETGPTAQLLQEAQHPYTRGLLACRPSLTRKFWRLPTVQDFLQDPGFEAPLVAPEATQQRRETIYTASPLLEVKELSVRYPASKNRWGGTGKWLEALCGLNFAVYPGEIFGIAGESGCGKSTLGRVVSRLQEPQEGSVWYRKLHINGLDESEFHRVRREIQMVFQDPYSSLNPRMLIGAALTEALKAYQLYGSERQLQERVVELLETVGLEADHARRYPSEFSGGQRQRICLARALALQPKLLICDEIVSALDVSVQATILNLLLDLQEQFGLTYLFISHDLSVIKQMCDRVMVLRQGKIEATGTPEDLYTDPESPYVRDLIAAIPGR